MPAAPTASAAACINARMAALVEPCVLLFRGREGSYRSFLVVRACPGKGRVSTHLEPFAAVVAKGSYGSRQAERFPPTLPVYFYIQTSHVRSTGHCQLSRQWCARVSVARRLGTEDPLLAYCSAPL
jgi:hypothetical protein